MTCINCTSQICSNRCSTVSQYEIDTLNIIEAAHGLRQLFNLSVDSGEACDHATHQDAYREAFSQYTAANEQYDLAGITEHLALCTLILSSYKADAGDAMQLHFDSMNKDLHVAAALYDIDLKKAVTALIDSESTKLVTSQQINATREHYDRLHLAVDFIHCRDSRFACIGKGSGLVYPGLDYTPPNWEDTEHWSRLKQQAA
ncbi:MAG: hypothetical protein OIF55_19170 [Amphritea sp.]|nr:hypothetical protein [Amphritea sp.]